MKSILKNYFVDLNKGKIYIENDELPKNDLKSHINKLTILIDKDIDNNNLLFRLLNVYSYIFNNPSEIKIINDNETISKWANKHNINITKNSDILNNILNSDAVFIIWNNEPDDMAAFKQLNKEYIFINYQKITNNEFVLHNNFYINDNEKTISNGQIKIAKNRWLPQPGIIKL